MTKLERLDAQIADARKQLDKATIKRDDAIKALIKSAATITKAQRDLGRISKRRIEARQEAKRAKVSATQQAEPIAPL